MKSSMGIDSACSGSKAIRVSSMIWEDDVEAAQCSGQREGLQGARQIARSHRKSPRHASQRDNLKLAAVFSVFMRAFREPQLDGHNSSNSQ